VDVSPDLQSSWRKGSFSPVSEASIITGTDFRRGARAAEWAGLENRCQPTVNPSQAGISENDENDLAFCLALLARKSADLALLVERWDSLPEAVRAGIVAMVKAT
jgi:hypothetical protein